MAGIRALYPTGGLNESASNHWYLCPNGKVLEPLDILLCLFPNKGREIGDNACFVARPFQFPLLQSILPKRTEYFLPEELVDGLVALSILFIMIGIGMIIARYIWSKVDSTFGSIEPRHKQWYVVANLTKAFFLAILASNTCYWIGAYRGFSRDQFQMLGTKRCAIIYSATDLVSLFLVPKLPKSTKFHHLTTAAMCIIISALNLEAKGWDGLLGVCKMGVLYGLFSSVAFPVNAYLALRVVYSKAKWLVILVKLSLWTYILCCIGNWGMHGLWMFDIVLSLKLSVANMLYMVALYFIVNDDIVLIKWLIKRESPMTTSRSLATAAKSNGEQQHLGAAVQG